ncbi:MAG: branched-chain amino acid transport system ATP-binding protein [Actinomycetota bacterium]|jgi:branched-chain amino acid transport system ATP-binding protein|nr:branched-chain amino acid transport system ATP-binding protein [Actinomycetota bacterium]MDQ1500655.1 branched-chain amino acid transport system ATP-binding protein [Actinomycetota bacterium]MDQ1504439.1 branched-chain amino acid transport system ATP-binding protein [Actinomycetota bacterium]
MSLTVSGLVAGYGATTVLRGVDLVVPAGHVVALLGPNGSGKTTLLRACSGLLSPSAGTVTVDGADRTGAAPHDLVAAGVCHVPEGRAVFPAMTVGENLRLLAPPGMPDYVERAADAFPVLGRRLDQAAGTLSGGEQQMLALARAFLRAPRYILLDEVSMGLAPRVVDEIFAALRRLAERGSALLLVEQFVHLALAMSDLVYVMDRGRIAFQGEPVELDAAALAAAYLAAGTRA